jgi:hypothetical protein
LQILFCFWFRRIYAAFLGALRSSLQTILCLFRRRRSLSSSAKNISYNVPQMQKLPDWRHDADTKLTAMEPSDRQFGAALRPAFVCWWK